MGCASTLSKVPYISMLMKNLEDGNFQKIMLRSLLTSFRADFTTAFNRIGYEMDVYGASNNAVNNNTAETNNDPIPAPVPDRPATRTARSTVYERSIRSQRTSRRASIEHQEPSNPSRQDSSFSIVIDNPPIRRPRSSSRGRNCRVGFGGRWDDSSNVTSNPNLRNTTANRQVGQSSSRTVSFQSTYTGNSDYGTGRLNFSRNDTSGIADTTDFSREHTFLR